MTVNEPVIRRYFCNKHASSFAVSLLRVVITRFRKWQFHHKRSCTETILHLPDRKPLQQIHLSTTFHTNISYQFFKKSVLDFRELNNEIKGNLFTGSFGFTF
jgi:hypothetical protein